MSDPNQNETTTPAQQTAVVPAPKREVRVVSDDSSLGYMLDTARFEHTYRIAGAMARASLIPKHLKGSDFEQTQANCFLVVNQSLRWELDPFIVMASTYEVGGKLAFEGKLIAAVINARANLEERLSYEFNDGKGDALELTVSGKIRGEKKARTITITVGQARTENKMWTRDPHQKLIYNGAIKWARRHMPEIILGIISDDDAEQIKQEQRFIEATPAKTPSFPGMPANAIADTSPAPDQGPVESEKLTPAPETVKAKTKKVTPAPDVVTKPAEAETKAPEPVKEPAKTPPDDGSDLFDKEETKTPTQLDELVRLMGETGITAYSMIGFCAEKKLMKADAKPPYAMADIKEEKLVTLCGHVGSKSKTFEAIRDWKPAAA